MIIIFYKDKYGLIINPTNIWPAQRG